MLDYRAYRRIENRVSPIPKENDCLFCSKKIVLDHVENRFVFVQPHVVIRNSHRLERYGFGIFEKRIWSPDIFQPIDFQQSRKQVFENFYFYDLKSITPTATGRGKITV